MGEIFLEEPTLKGNRFTSKVLTSGNIGFFIKNTEFFAEYDADITKETSLLNIPLTATVLPLAWLNGCNIHVDILDKTFKKNMDSLQILFKKMYPLLPGTTEIITKKLVENNTGDLEIERKTGLLFSGGIDSTYSLITNLEKNPRLIMIWGSDDFPYPERSIHWEKAITTYRNQSKKLHLDLNVIKTNVSQILHDSKIEHAFYKIINYGYLRDALQHSLVLLPMAAPLSINRFNHLLLASSAESTYDFDADPYACRPEADEKIVWADLKVTQDGQIYREEKVEQIARYLEHDNLIIRVCTRTDDSFAQKYELLNDCKCEKCYRTIMNLIQKKIDPNTCGFKVENTTFKMMRNFLEKKYDPYNNYYWENIKSEIPEHIEYDMYGSKEFQEYLRKFQLPEQRKPKISRDLYFNVPYESAKYILKYLYKPLKIEIH